MKIKKKIFTALILLCIISCNNNAEQIEQINKKLSEIQESNKRLEQENLELKSKLENSSQKEKIIRLKGINSSVQKNRASYIVLVIKARVSNGYSTYDGELWENISMYSRPIEMYNPTDEKIYKALDEFEDDAIIGGKILKREYKTFDSYMDASLYVEKRK